MKSDILGPVVLHGVIIYPNKCVYVCVFFFFFFFCFIKFWKSVSLLLLSIR